MADGYSRQEYVEGKQLDVAVNASNGSVDWQYAERIKLVGVKVMSETDLKWGDYAEVTLHNPTDDSEIGRFGKTLQFVTGKADFTIETYAEGAPVPKNVKIRLKLYCTDTTGRKLALWLITRK